MNTKFTPIWIGIILLTLATAAIHFTLMFPDRMFILNALGYLTLLAVYFLPVSLFQRYHSLLRWVYIGYALLTILAWVAIGDKAMALGWVTKAIEVVLVVLLFLDGRQEA